MNTNDEILVFEDANRNELKVDTAKWKLRKGAREMKAFPVASHHTKDGFQDNESGMDLRDYFAAKVMQGLMASQWQVNEPYSVYCYKIADEMIKAREE